MRRWVALAGIVLSFMLVWAGSAAAQAEGDTEGSQPTELVGTLRLGFDQFFAGVEITVADQSGTLIGQAVTDADGQWSVVVPGAGTYRVTLDESTLPDGTGLREGFESTVEAAVTEGASRAVVFAVGDAPKGTPFGERAAQTVFNGLKFGLIIAMSAIGLSLIYGTTGLVNFAHGELVTFGAVIAWYFNSSWGGLNLVLAAIVTMIVCGMLGAGLETGLFRPLRHRRLGIFQLVVVTIGLSLLGRQVIQLFFGAEPLPYTDFQVQERWEFGPWAVTPRELVTVVVIVAILLAVGIMLQWTRFGKATRAVSDNASLAEASGINVNRVVLMVWAMGAALAGLGGVFQGLDTDIDPFLGFQLLLLIFAGVELGGLGTAFGALAGSLIIGMSTEVSTLWISPELKFVVPLAALILVLLIRPHGLFGIKARVG
ncbi:MAG: branched-chain amino acid ABC transporter permease [bacterium]|nr:branched-chain amino acid ABC transporter permease [bacterium]MCY3889204.1 branched-chain amino acid ABC transporter permease [bacterium]MCY4134610.1 branched-chain amino acid ABC transporter permease [bacterium]